MAEKLSITGQSKAEKYLELLPQIKALIGGESDQTANLANVAAALNQTFDFLWVGFYLVKADELVLGPFQGPIACTRIRLGKGVCGSSWEQKKTLIVDDVNAFPDHIACSFESKSEIAIPLIRNTTVIGILDIDSAELNSFDETDELFLTELCQWLCTQL